MSGKKACFVDRDGIVNELVYYPEPGIVGSPFTAKQFVLSPGIGAALRTMKAAGVRAGPRVEPAERGEEAHDHGRLQAGAGEDAQGPGRSTASFGGNLR